MRASTQDRFLACAITAALLLLLWQIAAWIEVQSHISELQDLEFAESFESVTNDPASSVSPVAKPLAKPIVRRQTPQIPKLEETQNPGLIPNQRIFTNTLNARRGGIELTPGHRNAVAPSPEVTTRISPTSSGMALRKASGIELQGSGQPNRLATAEVTARSNAPNQSPEASKGTGHQPSRVLKAEEAKKIIQWMQISRSELPPGVKRHVDYQPGNLTSTAFLEYEGETWEIYLMARMPSDELHVVIVRGDDTYYVVDPSFKREGRRFRIGVARRAGNEITGITSEERAASSKDAVLHYDIFLAWWDEMRLTLQ
ncbi:MAG: hypothetical protein OXF48_02380 [Bacteroidetes bacterium]|nr:hypothetical protein [Bacteroidota bacterium]